MNNAIFAKVTELVANQMGISASSLKVETNLLEDLKADSANLLMIVMDLENEFNVQVDDASLANIKTIGDIVTTLEGLVK